MKYTDLKEANKRIRELEQGLGALVLVAGVFLRRLDATMQEPESTLRGKKIAHLSNELELARDKARYFTMHINFRKDPEIKDGIRVMPIEAKKYFSGKEV